MAASELDGLETEMRRLALLSSDEDAKRGLRLSHSAKAGGRDSRRDSRRELKVMAGGIHSTGHRAQFPIFGNLSVSFL